MEPFRTILNYTMEDLDWNKKGKVSPVQRKKIKEETSSAVRDLFYIAIVFPTVLIVSSSVILLIWLFLHSPELIREVALGCMGVAFLFYLVRKVLLKDLWDSSTVLLYRWNSEEETLRKQKSNPLPSHSTSLSESRDVAHDFSDNLYSNETRYPFHLDSDLESEFQNFKQLLIYYNPTHKKILSVDQE